MHNELHPLMNKILKKYPRFNFPLFFQNNWKDNENKPAYRPALLQAFNGLINAKDEVKYPFNFCEHIFQAEWQNINAGEAEAEHERLKKETIAPGDVRGLIKSIGGQAWNTP